MAHRGSDGAKLTERQNRLVKHTIFWMKGHEPWRFITYGLRHFSVRRGKIIKQTLEYPMGASIMQLQ